MIWLALVVIVVDLTLAFLFWQLRIDLSAEARGDPSGSWAIAGGVSVGPLAASGVAAAGISPRGQLHLFGKAVSLRRKKKEQPDPPLSAEDLERWRRRAVRGYTAVSDRVPLDELIGFLLEERRRIDVRQLDVALSYSFRDIILTGKLMAVLSVLQGVLPPPISLSQEPSWDWVDRLRANVQGSIVLWPGWMLVDVTWFVLTRVKLWGPSSTGLQGPTGRAAK